MLDCGIAEGESMNVPDNTILLDMQTANAVITVYRALAPPAQAQMKKLPAQSAASIAWGQVRASATL